MRLKNILVLAAALFSQAALAQSVSVQRIGHVTSYHATVGTTTAAAISSAGQNLVSFKICNDAVNTSTYLLVGQAADAATDGTSLGLGQCYVCEQCKASVLLGMKVKAQAASNGYSVIQYRQ